MRLQTDPEWSAQDPVLGPIFHRWSCLVFSLLRCAEVAASKNLSDDDVFSIYKRGQVSLAWDGKEPVIGENSYVADPNELLRFAAEQLGTDHRLYQIGKKDLITGAESWWGLKDPPDQTVDFTIIQGETPYGTPENPGLHFRAGDGQGNEIYNPDPSVNFISGRERTALVYYQLRVG